MGWNNFLLFIADILELFRNILTADDKRESIPQPIKMQLSKKTKIIISIFCCISETNKKIDPFEKKDEPHT